MPLRLGSGAIKKVRLFRDSQEGFYSGSPVRLFGLGRLGGVVFVPPLRGFGIDSARRAHDVHDLVDGLANVGDVGVENYVDLVDVAFRGRDRGGDAREGVYRGDCLLEGVGREPADNALCEGCRAFGGGVENEGQGDVVDVPNLAWHRDFAESADFRNPVFAEQREVEECDKFFVFENFEKFLVGVFHISNIGV